MARPHEPYILEILELEGLLRAYLHRFAPKTTDLEDLLQETYARLLDISTERRTAIQTVQAFALTTARNVAIDWTRRRRVVPLEFVEDLDAVSVLHDSGRTDEIVDAHMQLLRLADAVGELPPRCAEVFTLKKVYGWSQQEIATHFGIAVSTVENHIVKAMRHCTEHMQSSSPRKRSDSWIDRWRRQGEKS